MPTPSLLIVDDSQTVRTAAANLLANEGYEVATAEDGYEALLALKDRIPDILFLDLTMPKLDGFQVCAILKHSAQYQKIPIVLFSNHDTEFDFAKGRLVQADAYLVKPFVKSELLACINKLVGTD